MKHLLILLISIISVTSSFSQEESTTNATTYYFIRHAEKDRSDATNKDPRLTDEGKVRAMHWSTILGQVNFDAIYSTDYNRTKETAMPVATKNKLILTIYNPREIDAKGFISDTEGKTVLVVGHSNTTPMFVNAIIGTKKYKNIDDSNNGNIYIVTIIDGKISDQVLTIN
ncbi:phosphoglycerate mutase [Flavobacteriales bacterium 34_180_T64]|nr:phosphoglycerate mutase [Flavobacteriales bacterium 34_180_T64]